MATNTLTVTASNDGYENSSGSVNNSGTAIFCSNLSWGFFHFPDVPFSPGDTLDSAVLHVNVRDTYETAVIDVFADKVANSAAPDTGTTNDISGRSLTTAKTSLNTTLVDGWQTITVTDPLAEVFALGGWANNNDITVIIQGLSGSNLRIWSVEQSSSYAAYLVLTTTAGSSFNIAFAVGGQQSLIG